VSANLIKSTSTKNSICLATADNKSYRVIAEGASCPANFDFNGSANGTGTENN
jgi:hypothetical protein